MHSILQTPTVAETNHQFNHVPLPYQSAPPHFKPVQSSTQLGLLSTMRKTKPMHWVQKLQRSLTKPVRLLKLKLVKSSCIRQSSMPLVLLADCLLVWVIYIYLQSVDFMTSRSSSCKGRSISLKLPPWRLFRSIWIRVKKFTLQLTWNCFTSSSGTFQLLLHKDGSCESSDQSIGDTLPYWLGLLPLGTVLIHQNSRSRVAKPYLVPSPHQDFTSTKESFVAVRASD